MKEMTYEDRLEAVRSGMTAMSVSIEAHKLRHRKHPLQEVKRNFRGKFVRSGKLCVVREGPFFSMAIGR